MFTNYKYVVTPNKVIALSTYAGRTVRGIAKCHPQDTFDEEFGKALAAARCNEKVTAKRYAAADKRYVEMCKKFQEMEKEAHQVADYLRDAYLADKEAKKLVKELCETLI